MARTATNVNSRRRQRDYIQRADQPRLTPMLPTLRILSAAPAVYTAAGSVLKFSGMLSWSWPVVVWPMVIVVVVACAAVGAGRLLGCAIVPMEP